MGTRSGKFGLNRPRGMLHEASRGVILMRGEGVEDRVPDLIGPALRERLGGFSRGGSSLSERLGALQAVTDVQITVESDLLTIEIDER